MNLAVIGQIGTLAKEALVTNSWGLGCPSYFQGSSLPGLFCAYLLGLLSGLCLSLALWIWIRAPATPLPPDSPSSVSVVHQTAAQLRSRLRGYRPVLNEHAGSLS